MFSKINKTLIVVTCLLTSSLLMLMGTMMASALIDMNPDPDSSQPGITGNEYWDFNIGDVVSYKTDMYTNGSFMSSQMDTYNITGSSFDYMGSTSYYYIETTSMFWNATINGLQETPFDQYNMSLVNFTNYELLYDESGAPFPALFIPHNGTTGLHLSWAAQAYIANLNYMSMYGGNPTSSINGNHIYIYDANSVFDSYYDLYYYSNGTLETGEIHMDYDMFGMGTQTYNLTRNYNFNPADEVEWNAEVGDIFYCGLDLQEAKINVTGIEITDYYGDAMQVVYGDMFYWNATIESWEIEQVNTEIGVANEYTFNPLFIIPKGRTISEVAVMYSMYSTVIVYDENWIYMEESDGSCFEIKYFPNGVLQYRRDQNYVMEGLNNYTMDESATYSWTDISTSGTLLNTISGGDDNSESILLPWEVPFYGANYSEIYVGSNGWMSYVNTDPWDFSGSIPGSESCIAPFWDDLDPSSGGNIYYQFLSSPDRLVIQYDTITNYNGFLAGTWQALIYRSGDIEFQYQNVQNLNDGDVTIGIDNGDYEYYNVYNDINSMTIPISSDAVYFTYNPGGAPTIENHIYYYKNMTTFAAGIHTLEFSPIILGENFNITIDFELTDITNVLFSGFPENPTNDTLPFEELMFFDFMVNKSANILSPYTITIEYNQTLKGAFYLWIYNHTLDYWEFIAYDSDNDGIITLELDHNSIFGLSAGLGDPPGPFTASSPDAGSPDTDGIYTISWTNSDGADYYNLYSYVSPITEINASLTLIDFSMTNNSRVINDFTVGTHYYVVLSVNDSGSTMSNNVMVSVGLPGDPPGTTTISSSDAGSPDTDGTFTLDWTASDGADSYSLYWSDSTITASGQGNLIESGLTNTSRVVHMAQSGTYYFAVVAINGSGNTLSNNLQIEVLFPPGDFALSSDADDPDLDGSFNLIWTQSADAQNYSVYVYNSTITQINASLTLLADENAVSPYTIDVSSGIYHYAIVAKNDAGATLSNSIKVNVSIPPGPFGLYSNAGDPDTDGNFQLTWDSSLGADNYSVFLYNSPITEINGSLTVLADQTGTQPFDVSVGSGVYYYAVAAYNETGQTLSNWIKVDVEIPPGPFTLSTNVSGGIDYNGIFELSWTMSAGADNYSIYRYDSPITEFNASLILVEDQTALTPEVVSINAGVHYYVVIAYNETGFTLSNDVMVDVRIPPSDVSLSTNAENPDTDGAFNLEFSSSGANNYSIYEYSSLITEINGSLILVADQTATSPYSITKEDGTYYYMIVAFNDYGNSTSQCISITVQIEEEDGGEDSGDDSGGDDPDLEIPFGHYYLVFMAIGVVALIILEKKKRLT